MSEGKRKRIEDIPVVPLPPDWNNFQSKDIPSYFNYGHIHHYALESIEGLVTDHDEDGDCDLGHMTDKPLKNGRKYVDSGFVHDVMDALEIQRLLFKGIHKAFRVKPLLNRTRQIKSFSRLVNLSSHPLLSLRTPVVFFAL